jgi:2-polyprenyl-3-methyl-5-hydroxy-6-metoxy-1,4-benzoquinol methylase
MDEKLAVSDTERQIFKICPNCDSARITHLGGFERHHLMHCKACDFVFDRRLPSPAELKAHYEIYSYSSRKSCSSATIESYSRLLDEFEALRKTGRILDVGCGQGDFLLQAKKRGWRVHGTEYSPAAVELCQKADIDVVQGQLSGDTFAGLDFDVVTSFEVFEHINNGPSEIEAIADKMRSGGLFYLTTPNFNALLRYLERDDFKMIEWPEHISFYTPVALRALATRAGLRVKKIRTTGIAPDRLKAALRPRGRANGIPDVANRAASERREGGEALRARIAASPVLQFARDAVNVALWSTGLGDTLKGWMIKP